MVKELRIQKNKKFGDILKQCRESVDLTQRQLGEKVFCHYSEICRFEKGKIPQSSTLQRIMKVLSEKGISDSLQKELLNEAGYDSRVAEWLDTPPATQEIFFVNQSIGKLPSEDDKAIASDLILAVFETYRIYCEARKKIEEGEHIQASKYLRQARRQSDKLERALVAINALEGKINVLEGKNWEAINYFEMALQSAKTYENVQNDLAAKAKILYIEGNLLVELGDTYRQEPNWDTALEYYSSAKEIFSRLENEQGVLGVARCMLKTANIHNFRGRGSQALGYCNEPLAIAVEKKNSNLLYRTWHVQAWAYLLEGQWREAVELNEKALDQMKQLPYDLLEHLKAYVYLGDAYRLCRNYNSAETYYKRALQTADNITNSDRNIKSFKGKALLGLGRLYLKRPALKYKGTEYIEKSVEVYREIGNDYWIAGSQNEWGNSMIMGGDFEQASRQIRQSANRFKRLDAPFFYILSLADLCELHYQQKDHFTVYNIADEANKANDGSNNLKFHLAKISLIVAKALIDTDQDLKALNQISLALEHSIQFNQDTFCEILEKISEKGDALCRERKFDKACLFYQAGEKFIASRNIASPKSSLRMLEEAKNKLEEIAVLI